MAKDLTNNQKRDYAETLFLRTDFTQKEIAVKSGVSEQTITAWKDKYSWEAKRKSLLVTKQEMIRRLYTILDRLTRKIEDDDNLGDTKEADKAIKYASAIKALETELSISEIMEVGMMFVKWLQLIDMQLALTVANHLDKFINERLKRF